MSEGFDVDLDTLARHATRVDIVGDDIALAQGAARSTNIYDGAFGVLCAFLPVAVIATDYSARSAIDTVLSTTREMAAGIRAMAQAYQATDAEVAAFFARIQAALS